MTGFDPNWLHLREAVDHRSRNRALLAELAEVFAGRAAIAVVDLGCGLGSNLRGLYEHLPERQHWRLVDHDAALLAAAREELAGWADACTRNGDDIAIEKKGRSLHVTFVQADLARDLESVLDPAPDLVTAAALFDLCSREWIGRFAEAVAARKLVFYTSLTYDGREIWQPAHLADSAMLAAFHVDQITDKGFGRSAGPEAPQALVAAFGERDYATSAGDSFWRLGEQDAPLLQALANGIASAVTEGAQLDAEAIASWRAARLAPGVSCMIGHRDCLCRPA
jgi:SAM-dependent methyltransferase